MTYTKTGPFTNAAAPAVDATFFNNLETTLVAVAAPVTALRVGFTHNLTNVYEGATPDLAAYYKVTNGDVIGKTRMVFQSDSAVSGTILFDLPVALKNTTYGHVGSWIALDTSAGSYYSGTLLQSTDANHAALAINGGGFASASAPFVWATGDRIWLDFRYEAY